MPSVYGFDLLYHPLTPVLGYTLFFIHVSVIYIEYKLYLPVERHTHDTYPRKFVHKRFYNN